MDGTSDEIRLREIQREYLDFLDDEVNTFYSRLLTNGSFYSLVSIAARSRILQRKSERHDRWESTSIDREHKRFATQEANQSPSVSPLSSRFSLFLDILLWFDLFAN